MLQLMLVIISYVCKKTLFKIDKEKGWERSIQTTLILLFEPVLLFFLFVFSVCLWMGFLFLFGCVQVSCGLVVFLLLSFFTFKYQKIAILVTVSTVVAYLSTSMKSIHRDYIVQQSFIDSRNYSHKAYHMYIIAKIEIVFSLFYGEFH